MNTAFDVIVKNGLLMDGTGAPAVHRHVGIRQGRVAVLSEAPLDEAGCPTVIDAQGCWVVGPEVFR